VGSSRGVHAARQRHGDALATRGTDIGGALARLEQRRLGVLSHGQKTPGRSETDSVGTVALGRAQFGAQCCFSNYSNFTQISKYKTKTITMSKIIETLHGVRVDHSKQLLPLGPLPILNTIQVIKLGTTSTLNFSLNF
jgi:hypothetical protein